MPDNPFAQFGPSPIQVAAPVAASADANPFAQFGPSPIAPSPPGFIDRLTQDVKNAWSGAGQQIANNNIKNQILGPVQVPDPRNLMVMGGAAGRTTAAPIIEAVKSAWNYTPQNAQDYITKTLSGILNSSPVQAVAKPVGDAINASGQAYDQWAQGHPQTADAVSDLGQNASNMVNSALIPVEAMPTIIDKFVTPAGEILGNAGVRLNNAMGDTIRATPDEVKAASTAGYGKVENSGLSFPQTMIDGVVNDAQSRLPQTVKAQTAFGQSDAGKLLQSLDVYKESPLTLQEANELDQQLGDFISNKGESDLGKLNADGKQVYKVQQNLRQSMMKSAQDGSVSGNPDDVSAWQSAVKDWAAQSQMNDIQRIVDKGNMMDNSPTSIKNGFKNLANSSRINGFSPDVQSAIRQVGGGAPIQNFFRTGPGSRLLGMVGGAAGAGLPGAVAGFAVSSAAREAAGTLQQSQIDKVMDAIAGHSSLPTKIINQPINPASDWFPQYGPQEAPPAPPQLALPAPTPDMLPAAGGAVRAATPQEQATAIGARQDYASKGLTPDVLAVQARNELQSRFGPAWDQFDADKQKAMTDQIVQAWNQQTQQSMQSSIANSVQNAGNLSQITGQPPSPLAYAFQKAQEEFNAKKALKAGTR